MSKRKIYSLKIDVVPKCITEDSQNKVYLSFVKIERVSTWLEIKKFVIERLRGITKVIFKALVSLSLTAVSSVVILEMAYKERGYEAVGGEYLLLIIIFLSIYKLLGKAVGNYD